MAAALVTLHVAADAEGLAAAGVRALEGLLAGVGVAVDAEGRRAGEGLVAGLADVAVLALGEGRRGGGGDVVVVLPRVGARVGTHADGDGGHGRELLGQRALVVEALDLGLGRRRGLHGRVVGRRHGVLGGHVGGRERLRLGVGGLDGDPRDDGSHGAVGVDLEGRR